MSENEPTLEDAQNLWAAEVKKMQDAAAVQFPPEAGPESPYIKILEAEARRLAQEGKNGESLMLWARLWEEKAAAWEAVGKPEYAAAERAQAEQCRRQLASIDEVPRSSNFVNTWGDVVSQIEHLGRVLSFSDRQSLDALEEICRKRGIMVGLSFTADEKKLNAPPAVTKKELRKAVSHVFAWYSNATQKSIDDDTPLVDIVATLRGSDDDRWCTVAEAEAIYGINRGQISRAAGKHIKTNGKSGRKRRLDRADLKRWAREIRPEIAD